MSSTCLDYKNLTIQQISQLPGNERKEVCRLSLESLRNYKKYNRLLTIDNTYVSYLNGLNQILNELELDTRIYINLHNVVESISKILLNNTSYDFFSGDVIAFYPSIKELRASNFVTCCMSGSIIKPGSYYCYYRPILENLDTNVVYALQNTIKCETSYYDYLPQNIIQFEDFNRKLSDFYCNNEIDFYNINTLLGVDSLGLKNLKKVRIGL